VEYIPIYASYYREKIAFVYVIAIWCKKAFDLLKNVVIEI